MNLTTTTVGSATVVRMEGDLDSASAPGVQEELSRLVAGGATRLLLNFGGVGFVSSAGLRAVILTAKKLITSGGELRVSSLNDPVTQVFEISGLVAVLKVFDTEEEALQGF